MTKHIHIHLPTKTKDEQKHAPAGSPRGGQFVSGGSSSGNGAPTSQKAPKGHASGSTHQIAGYQAPSGGKGHHTINHEGQTFTYTGKSGNNLGTGEESHEYEGPKGRVWITKSGYLRED